MRRGKRKVQQVIESVRAWIFNKENLLPIIYGMLSFIMNPISGITLWIIIIIVTTTPIDYESVVCV